MQNVSDNLHNEQAEMAALGSQLLDNSAIGKVLEVCRAEDYYFKKHRVIQQSIETLYQKGESVNLISLTDDLAKSGLTETAGGTAYISSLTDEVPTSAQAETFGKIVSSCAVKRRTDKELKTLLEENLRPDSDPFKVRQKMAETKTTEKNDTKSYFAFIEELVTTQQQTEPGAYLGYKMSYFGQELTDRIDGIQKQSFIIIAGDSNIGKSATTHISIIDLILSNPNLNVLVATLDDSTAVFTNRLLSILTWINYPAESAEQRRERLTAVHINRLKRRIDDSTLKAAYKKAAETLIQWAADGRLEVRDVSQIQTDSDLESWVREKSKQGELALFADALYNLTVQAETASIREQNIERANFLKRIANDYQIPVVVSAELRKPSGNNQKPRDAANPPKLSDLMETQKYEYNSDLAIMVYPEDMDSFRADQTAKLIFDIQKNKTSSFKGRLFGDFYKTAGVIDTLRPYYGQQNQPTNGGKQYAKYQF